LHPVHGLELESSYAKASEDTLSARSACTLKLRRSERVEMAGIEPASRKPFKILLQAYFRLILRLKIII